MPQTRLAPQHNDPACPARARNFGDGPIVDSEPPAMSFTRPLWPRFMPESARMPGLFFVAVWLLQVVDFSASMQATDGTVDAYVRTGTYLGKS